MIIQQFIELAKGHLIEVQADDNLPTSRIVGYKALICQWRKYMAV
jgi:hypothetical protein